jgi:hypothetical protein
VFRKYLRQDNLNMYFFFCISGENACFFSLTTESNNLMKHSLNKLFCINTSDSYHGEYDVKYSHCINHEYSEI